MSITLSSISSYVLSSVFESGQINYINNNRNTNYTFLSENNLIYPEFTQNIRNTNFKNSYYTFLTNYSNLSSYFNTIKTVNSLPYGHDMKEFNAGYDWKKNNFSQSYTSNNSTQFLGILDYNYNFNILPLKTKNSVNNKPYSVVDNCREYQSIYNYNDSIFLQFKTDKIPFEILPDKYSLLFNSYNVASCYVNDAEFIKNGAIGGNCPLNSDVIFFEQNEYGNYTNNGTVNANSVNNGTLLCLWLSSQTVEPSSNKIWMERWYDPNTVTQGNAFITQKNTLSSSFSYIIDLPSLKILSEKEKLTYLRYGPSRNETFVNSLSSNLQIEFSNWAKNFSSEVNEISGFIIGNESVDSSTLVLDGATHAHVPPEDVLFIQDDLSVALWVKASDWKNNNDSQFFGNYHDESGYGLFYNTGTSNNLISIPTSADNLFALNNKGYKVFEKDLKNDLGLSNISINYIKTDLFGNRWIYDNFNQNLYKIENDDLVIKTVKLPPNAEITKIECNSYNEIFILDNFTHQISCFDSSGTSISSISINSYYDNFDIDLNDNIICDIAEFLTVNSKNVVVKMLGPTLFINNERVLHLTDKPQSVRIDLYDNIWILFKNRVIKTDSSGNVIFDKTLHLSFTDTDGEMCFVKTNKQNVEDVQLWIIFNKAKYVTVLNSEGDLVKRIDLSKLFVGKYCSTFQLNIVGDFTGFDNKRKFEQLNGAAITPKNPAFTVRVGLKCGNFKKIVRVHASTDYASEWTHLSMSVSNSKDFTTVNLFVNGRLASQKIISGNYKIDYGYKSSPFIIGGVSGKLGAKNLEKSIIGNGFFIGEVDDIRIYNKKLNDYEMLNLSLTNHYNKWESLSFHIKSPKITMIEEVETFHINRYKGIKSNYFNINIKNFTTDENLKTLVRDYINSNISQFVPANTILNDIKFE